MTVKTALIVGASRGLGYAMVEEFVKHGWCVIGTVRQHNGTPLHDFATRSKQVEFELLDINVPSQITALRQRLTNRTLDLLFINAGTTNARQEDIVAEVSMEEFNRVMVTNAFSPMRVLEALEPLAPKGVIGIMSSGQGSVANNTRGMREVYRGSKAALNTFMRSFAVRHEKKQRAMVLMAPGWVRTDLGGDEATLSIEESVPSLVNVLLSVQGQPGLQYLDYTGRTVPW